MPIVRLTAAYIKRSVLSPMFAVCSLICAVLMIFFVYRDYQFGGDNLGLFYFLQGVDSSGAFNFLMLVAAFPAVLNFCFDYESGYFTFITPRCGVGRYALSISFSTGIISGAAIIISYLLFSFFILTKYPLVPNLDMPTLKSQVLGFANSGLLLEDKSVVCYILFFLTRAAMTAYFSVFAVTCSIAVTNKHLTSILPLLIYVIFDMVKLPIFLNPSLLYENGLALYLKFGGDIEGGLYSVGSALYPFIYCAVSVVLLSAAAKFLLARKIGFSDGRRLS